MSPKSFDRKLINKSIGMYELIAMREDINYTTESKAYPNPSNSY